MAGVIKIILNGGVSDSPKEYTGQVERGPWETEGLSQRKCHSHQQDKPCFPYIITKTSLQALSTAIQCIQG